MYNGWNQSESMRCILYAANMKSKKHLYGARDIGICPADFVMLFDPVFSPYIPIPLFCNGNVYSVIFYIGSV